MPFPLAPYDTCGFCRYVSGELPCALVAEDDLVIAFVNHRQYERGAALVIPKRHCATVLEVSPAEISGAHVMAKRLAHAMETAFGACGANIFQNNGIQAGQHVPHLHIHVVPRYPTSDSEKLFLQRNFPIVSMTEQQAIAAALRDAM